MLLLLRSRRVVVPAGRVGLAWDHGDSILLDPGRVYNVDSARFSYVASVPVNDALIVHGSIKIVTVKEGTWGISYDDGVLTILPSGRHTLVKPTHLIAGFLSAGQQVLQ